MNALNDPIEPMDPKKVHLFRCNELWAAVIAQAFKDADWSPKKGTTKNYSPGLRAYALFWLRGTTEGFRVVCDAADVDPSYVRRIARSRYGSLLDENWTPVELPEDISLSGVGSQQQKEVK